MARAGTAGLAFSICAVTAVVAGGSLLVNDPALGAASRPPARRAAAVATSKAKGAREYTSVPSARFRDHAPSPAAVEPRSRRVWFDKEGRLCLEVQRGQGEYPARLTAWQHGTLVLEAGVQAGVLNGTATLWFPNGVRRTHGTFKSGARDGEWLAWSDAGTLIERSNWRAGRLDGLCARYDSNGRVIARGRYVKGRESSPWDEWQGDGGHVVREGGAESHAILCRPPIWFGPDEGQPSTSEFGAKVRDMYLRANQAFMQSAFHETRNLLDELELTLLCAPHRSTKSTSRSDIRSEVWSMAEVVESRLREAGR